MKIDLALQQLGGSEAELVERLTAAGARHKGDHDVFHMTATLAKIERGHLDSLAPHAKRYGATLEPGSLGIPGPVRSLLEKSAELIAGRPEPALLLLHDLRRLHLAASEVSINWVILAQGAQAVKDAELLSTVSACHEETLRTLAWSAYRIKSAAPQVLAT